MKLIKAVLTVLLLFSTTLAQTTVCDPSNTKCYSVTVQADGTLTIRPASGYTPLVYDSFSRADAETLGNAETGQAWMPVRGTWKIRDRQAVCTQPDPTYGGLVKVQTNTTNVVNIEVELSYTAGGNMSGLLLRMSDASNYYWLRANSTVTQLYRVQAGIATLLNSAAQGVVPGSRLRAEIRDNTYTVKLNGAALFSVPNQTFNQTASEHGLYSDTSWLAFRHFTIDTEATVAEGVRVTSPTIAQTFQRNGLSQSDIAIEGLHSGFDAFEARFNGGPSQVITTTPGSTTFQGVLRNQPSGQGWLEVWARNQPLTVYRVPSVRVGDVFLAAGQSNMVGHGDEPLPYSHPTLKASVFDAHRRWRELTDPTHVLGAGSMLPEIATLILPHARAPVAFVTCAAPGAGLFDLDGGPGAWQPGQRAFNACVQTVQASHINGVRGVLWYDEETDANAQPPVPIADLKAANKNWRTQLSAALGFELDVLMFQVSYLQGYEETRTTVDNVRLAQAQVVDEDSHFYGPVVLYDFDLSTGDSLHVNKVTDLKEAARRASLFIIARYYGGNTRRGPVVSSATLVDSTHIDVTFNVSNGALLSASVKGWNIAVTEATLPASNKVRLTLAQPTTGGALSFGSYNDGAGATLKDSKSLPVEPFVGVTY